MRSSPQPFPQFPVQTHKPQLLFPQTVHRWIDFTFFRFVHTLIYRLMNRFSVVLLMAFALLLGSSCRQSVIKGEQKVSESSKQWLKAYAAGETLTFKSIYNQTLTLTVNPRKSTFNATTDCYDQGLKQICDSYQMESVFCAAQQPDSKLNISLTISRGIQKHHFYEVLSVGIYQEDMGVIKMSKTVLNESEQPIEGINEPELVGSLTLGNRTFQQVYRQVGNGSELYFTQEKGVVAFKFVGEGLWILQ